LRGAIEIIKKEELEMAHEEDEVVNTTTSAAENTSVDAAEEARYAARNSSVLVCNNCGNVSYGLHFLGCSCGGVFE